MLKQNRYQGDTTDRIEEKEQECNDNTDSNNPDYNANEIVESAQSEEDDEEHEEEPR